MITLTRNGKVHTPTTKTRSVPSTTVNGQPQVLKSFKTLGHLIRAYRETHRLTQEQLEKKLGVKQGMLSHYEHGNCRPNITVGPVIEKLLNVKMAVPFSQPLHRTPGIPRRATQLKQVLAPQPPAPRSTAKNFATPFDPAPTPTRTQTPSHAYKGRSSPMKPVSDDGIITHLRETLPYIGIYPRNEHGRKQVAHLLTKQIALIRRLEGVRV